MNYEKLLEKARIAYKNCATGAEKRRLESIFPELRNEDTVMKELLYNLIVSNDNTPSSKEIFSVYGKTKEDCLAWLEKQGEQKHVLNEEDEYQINTILNGLDLKREFYRKDGNKVEEERYDTQYNWLKSFKDRVGYEVNCTTTKEWSEEDEYQINTILHGLNLKKEIYKKRGNKVEEERYNTQYNWLKFCKDKYKNAVEYDKTCLEKQGEQKPIEKVEPKFKVGDKVLWKYDKSNPYTIARVSDHGTYWIEHPGCGSGWWSEKELEPYADKDEQKSAIGPKFKVGDWIICDGLHPTLILNIDKNKYEIKFTDNGVKGFHPIDFIERHYHLWTIEDAKDGDVLASHECYVMFKEIEGLNIRCHCTYYYMGYNPSFYEETLQNKTAFHPATKEQRDLLFKEMGKSGYKWDVNRKEMVSVLKLE